MEWGLLAPSALTSLPCPALSCAAAAGAVPLGLTAEPDALTVVLPPPYSSRGAPASSGELEAPSSALPLPSGLSTSCLGGSSDSTSTMAGSLWMVDSSSDGDDVGTSSSSAGSSSDGTALCPRRAAELAEPEARHVLVLACDGLWDMVTNEEAVGMALR